MATTLRSPPAPTVHVIGGGIMGLLAAHELRVLGPLLGLDVHVIVHEAGELGGARRSAATPRCQMWLHRQGVIYAATQPGVSLGLQQATARLCELVPESIRCPLSLAIDAGGSARASEFFRALGIWHEEVAPALVRAWLPELRLPDGCRVHRTRDGVLDLKLAVRELTARARAAGVEFSRAHVVGLEARGEGVAALRLRGGAPVRLGAGDVVVLATGTGTRGLLAASGWALPGLRVFRCTMLAARAGVPALLAFLGGGLNVVPHELPDGSSIDVFADSRRHEVAPGEDTVAFTPTAADVAALCADVEAALGIRLDPATCRSWVGLKAEVVPQGAIRSQADHVLAIPGVRNLLAAIPGKLSQAAGTARTVVHRLAREVAGVDVACSVWEETPRPISAVPVVNKVADRRRLRRVDRPAPTR